MNGGVGPLSYAQNSCYPKRNCYKTRHKKTRRSRHIQNRRLRVLNTVLAAQAIVEAVELKFQAQGLKSRTPEFQVFSSCALNWLSQPPEEISDQDSPAWNGGRIHYTSSGKQVYEAYAAQFGKDMARAEELVGGGLMALVVPATTTDLILHPQTSTILGSCLMDMANMGIVSKAKVESFNLPLYYTCPEELEQVIGRSGHYSIERMEILKNQQKHILMPQPTQRMLHLRSAFQGIIHNHFGSDIDMDQLFDTYSTKLVHSSFLSNPDDHKSVVLFVLLKRVTQ